MPNLFFHMSVAYALLRARGVTRGTVLFWLTVEGALIGLVGGIAGLGGGLAIQVLLAVGLWAGMAIATAANGPACVSSSNHSVQPLSPR
jgi:uncharacterized membrane protein YfcA